MNPSDETLMAYADGELDAATRKQVEESVAADPQVARRLAAHQALRSQLHASFDKVLEEPLPPHLVALVRSAAKGSQVGQVLQFPRQQAQRRAWLQWSSLAASFVLGALLWQLASRMYPTVPITVSKGELVAAGNLARALDSRLVSQQTASDPVQIGLSFRSRQGAYCRTFQLRETAAAGLACHANDDWKVQVLAREATTVQSQYRQAASALPPAFSRLCRKPSPENRWTPRPKHRRAPLAGGPVTEVRSYARAADERRTFSNFARSTPIVNGFAMKSAAPASRLLMSRSRRESPVIRIIGMWARCGEALSCRVSVTPSESVNLISMRMASGCR